MVQGTASTMLPRAHEHLSGAGVGHSNLLGLPLPPVTAISACIVALIAQGWTPVPENTAASVNLSSTDSTSPGGGESQALLSLCHEGAGSPVVPGRGRRIVVCRWLAYSGSPVLLEDLLFKPKNSLVVQSRHSQLGAESVNGDGFGVGWYGALATPGIFHSTEPAWNDRNLRELSAQASAGRVFAHIRATTGTAVQQSNCHPFRHGRWLWMHNGAIADFLLLKRDLTLAVEPGLFPDIEGSTDSELFFFLALTFGLTQDPVGAVARAVGVIEETGRRHGVEYPIQMTVATTDGDTTWAFRYSSEGRSRSLFHNADVTTLRLQYPDNANLRELSDDARLVVSEPLGDLRGAWREVPESTCVVVHGGGEEMHEFLPSPG